MKTTLAGPSRVRALSLVTLASCVLLPAAVRAAPPATLPERVSVAKEGDEEEAFDQIQDELVRAGMGRGVARQALKGFDRYIDRSVEREKRAVTIYPRALLEVAKAAALKGWSGNDISAVLVDIQAEIDAGRRAAEELAKVAAEEISKGSGRRAVLAALGASTGER